MTPGTYLVSGAKGSQGHLNRSAHARLETSDSDMASAWSILELPAAQAVRAWRCWRLIGGGQLGALVDAHGVWHSGVLRAQCRRTPDHPPSLAPPGHTAPDPACTCGINGYAACAEAMETLTLLGQWQPLAIGQVELWGRILVRNGAYRAEFAKIAGCPTPVTRVIGVTS